MPNKMSLLMFQRWYLCHCRTAIATTILCFVPYVHCRGGGQSSGQGLETMWQAFNVYANCWDIYDQQRCILGLTMTCVAILLLLTCCVCYFKQRQQFIEERAMEEEMLRQADCDGSIAVGDNIEAEISPHVLHQIQHEGNHHDNHHHDNHHDNHHHGNHHDNQTPSSIHQLSNNHCKCTPVNAVLTVDRKENIALCDLTTAASSSGRSAMSNHQSQTQHQKVHISKRALVTPASTQQQQQQQQHHGGTHVKFVSNSNSVEHTTHEHDNAVIGMSQM